MRQHLSLLLFASLAACQTTDRERPASDVQGEPNVPAPAEAPAAESAAPEAATLTVGPVADEEFRRLVYKALDAQISKKQALDDEGEQITEIGDFDSFKFTITRLGKGKDDATGSDVPDNADVDVTGWYKVSVSSREGGDKPDCSSFDATLKVEKTPGGDWHVPAGNQAQITREDGEDCF